MKREMSAKEVGSHEIPPKTVMAITLKMERVILGCPMIGANFIAWYFISIAIPTTSVTKKVTAYIDNRKFHESGYYILICEVLSSLLQQEGQKGFSSRKSSFQPVIVCHIVTSHAKQ